MGDQYLTFFLSNISFELRGSAYLKKYQEELTKVSIVSVSLFPSPPHSGQETLIQSSAVSRGFPFPNFTLWGSKTGKSFSGTGTTPQPSQ